MAAQFLKRHSNHMGCGGSAIVYWHEAEKCPPSVKALPLTDIESLEPGTRVSEKTLCHARYRDQLYPCVVLWIEEDKTPEELIVDRLLPTSNEKIFEEKGLRWARELQFSDMKLEAIDDKIDAEEACPGFGNEKFAQLDRHEAGDLNTGLSDQKKYHIGLRSDTNGLFQDEPLDMNAHSPAYESSAASASSGTYGSHLRPHIVTPAAQTNGRVGQSQKQGRKQKLPTKACSMVPIVTPVQRMTRDSSSSIRTSPLMDDLDDDEEFELAPSTSAADTTSLPVTNDTLVQRMLLESTWTKALRCAMRELFSGDELATSLPHQSKNGMHVLDPARLNVAKDLLVKYCTSKDIPQPSRRHVSQALHNCLISSRTTKFRMKKFSGKNSRYDFGDGRIHKPGKYVSRKMMLMTD